MTAAQETPAVEASVTEARDDFARLVRDAEYGRPAVITRNGKPRAYLVPITCGHCGAVIRVTVSGTNWVDDNGSDTCRTGDSHEPAATP